MLGLTETWRAMAAALDAFGELAEPMAQDETQLIEHVRDEEP